MEVPGLTASSLSTLGCPVFRRWLTLYNIIDRLYWHFYSLSPDLFGRWRIMTLGRLVSAANYPMTIDASRVHLRGENMRRSDESGVSR
jgi:hypothetical protein